MLALLPATKPLMNSAVTAGEQLGELTQPPACPQKQPSDGHQLPKLSLWSLSTMQRAEHSHPKPTLDFVSLRRALYPCKRMETFIYR